MATHSSILAWRMPWTEEPGGLQSTGSQRVGHDWSDLARSPVMSNRLYFLGLQNDCERWLKPWIKRRLLLGRKAMTDLDNIFKSRDITLLTKVHIVKALSFPVVMYGCESWTIKKAEHQRIDAFESKCWRRLLRVSWTARRSNQSILKEINPEYSLEGLILKLKLHHFGHLIQNWLIEKDPDAGKDWGQEEKGVAENEMVGWHQWLSGHGFEQTAGDREGQGSLVGYSPWGHKESDKILQLNITPACNLRRPTLS